MTITNIQTSSAYPGEGVKVTVDKLNTQDMQVFSLLYPGMEALSNTSSDEGIIHSIDRQGNSFIVVPVQPNLTFMGSEPYKLKPTDIISFNGGPVPPLPPLALTIANITDFSFDCAITPGDGNPPTTQYAIQDIITGKYLGSVGLLDENNPLWLTASQWSLAQINSLFPDTLYQMRAIARDPITLLTANGPSVNVTTNLPPGPYIAVRPASQNCGNVPVGNPSNVFSFEFKGILLDGTDVIIDSISFFYAVQCCVFSTSPAGPFSPTITYSGYGTSIPITTIYYTYTPIATGPDQGAVTLSGGGAFAAVNLDITGT